MNNTSRQARLELIFIFVIAAVVAVFEIYVDSFERLIIWAAENESLLITEIVTLAMVFSVGLAIYAWRRWRETILLEEDRARLQKTVTVEQDANRLMRLYADAMTQGQESERRRLARELHDDTIQRLIWLNQKIELAAFDYAESPASADLRQMQTGLDDTIHHLRRFIQTLRPTYLDELGLIPALNALIKETRERTDILIEFEVKGASHRLSEAIEVACYRITQSALSNIIQHANASSTWVVVSFLPRQVILTVEDDGDGFQVEDEGTLVKEGHFGLIGMRERAELIGATYGIRSTIGQGTALTITIPKAQKTYLAQT